MFVYIVILIIIIACYCTQYLYSKMTYWKHKNIPFVPPHWFFGNYKKFFLSKGSLNQFYENYFYHIDAKVVGLYKGPSPSLMIRDPDLIKRIMITDFNEIPNRYVVTDKDDFMMNLITYDVTKWKPLRQKITPIFTPNKLKLMFPLIKEKCVELVEAIAVNELKSNATDIGDLMAKYTTDVIGSINFGLQVNSMVDNDNIFRKMGRTVFEINLYKYCQYILLRRFPDLAKKLRVTPITKDTEMFFINLIKDVMKERKNTLTKRNDLIDVFIDIKKKQETQNDNNYMVMDDYFMAAQALSFFVAGFETTSSMMTFTLHELAYNQDVQDKIHKEIDDVLYETNGELTFESLEKMVYLDMVICESLRKYPVVYEVSRTPHKTFKIPEVNLTVEKDIEFIIPILGIHRDPKYYPEPQKFIPERFLPEAKSERHPMTYIPFGEGPRKCIAYKLAGMQGKTGLVSILREYRVNPCHKSQYDLHLFSPTIVLEVENGIWLKFVKK